ncbi:class I SAM-dependent methyltransferase [Sorangium sp. So ce269]
MTDSQLQADRSYATAWRIFFDSRRYDHQGTLDLMEPHLRKIVASGRRDLSILSVGPGPGDVDADVARLLRRVAPEGGSVRYVALEPNAIHREHFTAMTRRPELSGVQFDVRATRVEDFKTDERFDCVFYMHSIYHMPGQEERLTREALGMLNEGGFLAITVDHDHGQMYTLIKKYVALTGYQGYWTASEAGLITGESLKGIMERLGLQYETAEHDETIDVTLCFDDQSTTGKALLDFIYQTDFSAMSDDVKRQLLVYLNEEAVERDGRKLIHEPAVTVLVPRP